MKKLDIADAGAVTAQISAGSTKIRLVGAIAPRLLAKWRSIRPQRGKIHHPSSSSPSDGLPFVLLEGAIDMAASMLLTTLCSEWLAEPTEAAIVAPAATSGVRPVR